MEETRLVASVAGKTLEAIERTARHGSEGAAIV